MEYCAEFKVDGRAEAPAVGEDLDFAGLPGPRVVRDEAIGVRRSRRLGDFQAGGGECASQCLGDLDGLVGIDLSEQVDVVRRAVDEAVGDHRAATGERQGVRLRQR